MRKAFLLGAGLGTRLRPLTNAVPKPLIPLFHRPLISHAIDQCLAAGCSEFAVNTHHLPEAWPKYFPEAPDLPEGSAGRGRISFFHEPVLLETGGGIKNIESWIDGEPLLVYNGDILTDLPLDRLIEAHRRSGNRATLVLRSGGHKQNVALDGEHVVDLRHARGIHPGTHQFAGIYCIEPDVLPLIPPAEKVSIVPAFLQLAEEGSLGACVLDDGSWLDLGTRETYLAAHGITGDDAPFPIPGAQPVSPTAAIDPSARIENSIIGPDCQIGPNSLIINSLLWPGTSVSADARLTNCIVYSTNPAVGTHRDEDL
jgi:mannose-1-phosphate guanylyltransferase